MLPIDIAEETVLLNRSAFIQEDTFYAVDNKTTYAIPLRDSYLSVEYYLPNQLQIQNFRLSNGGALQIIQNIGYKGITWLQSYKGNGAGGTFEGERAVSFYEELQDQLSTRQQIDTKFNSLDGGGKNKKTNRRKSKSKSKQRVRSTKKLSKRRY